jgi:hypothetical protein
MRLPGQRRFAGAAEDQMHFRPIRAPLQQSKKKRHQTSERYESRQDLPELSRQ